MVTSNIYIFKATPYRESSSMYQAVAKGHGKITLIHKGIKTNKKRRKNIAVRYPKWICSINTLVSTERYLS